MLFVSRDDALYERVADDVAFAELNNGDAFGVFEHTMRLEQAGMFVRRQINLRFIAGDDCL
jgi:hypothetical protein